MLQKEVQKYLMLIKHMRRPARNPPALLVQLMGANANNRSYFPSMSLNKSEQRHSSLCLNTVSQSHICNVSSSPCGRASVGWI